ncbi:MAG: 23S rRNA (guanosine(2251)-2'-O)-methyltransferase RlmB [Candidatus Omnitrophota bacterium]
MYLYGKNSVRERLKANPRGIKKIYLADDFDDRAILNAIRTAGVKIQRLAYKRLTKIKRAEHLQGIIAEIDKFSYTPLESLFSKTSSQQLTLIFLDNLTDPQNLGAIIRSLACIGGFAVVIPEHNSCKITEAVLHVASGGENYVPVVMVGNTSKALMEAKQAGYWSAGAVTEGGEDIGRARLAFPLCLVLGSEGRGIRPGVIKHLDFKITLPMRGAALSFNAAIAAVLLSYEISERKRQDAR